VLEAAVAELRQQGQIAVLAVSRWHETTPIGGSPGQPPFLNGVLRAETTLDAQELLAFLQQVENRLGRCRGERWGPRTIDLDLLLYGTQVSNAPALILPHPRMAWRRFVIEPAAEVAGEMVHPTLHWTIARLLDHLRHARPYVAITGPIGVGKTELAHPLSEAIPARLIAEEPDWNELTAFYGDPKRYAWQTELQFLHQRAELLAANAPEWQEPGWTVSDFWFDQSAAFARVWLSEEQWPAFWEEYERRRRPIMRPKLTVFLDAPPEELLDRIKRRARPCERRLTLPQLERIRQAVRQQTEEADVGPVLRIAGLDAESSLAEVLAAVRAME
jgi:2-amino-4-hydroxy-6-hydroxymethyldihydropteridine diphosphokinase